MSVDRSQELLAYSACDIADALLKLEVPGAGFLPDISPLITPTTPTRTVAPASTVLFTPQSTPSFPSSSGSATSILTSTFSLPSPNIPKNTHWVDNTLPGSIAVLSQPGGGQSCAVLGGINASRMRVKGLKGVVVHGRVRDLGKLREVALGSDAAQVPTRGGEEQAERAGTGGREPMPVWSKGTSVIGAGAETKPWAINVPITVGGTEVNPGDYILLDPEERGAVCVPANVLGKVLLLLPKLVEAEGQVMEFVENGGLVSEAFRLYRG